MNIYVGNLPYRTKEEDLKSVFEKHGEVISTKIIMDRETGKSKGFGFVEMANVSDGQAAIKAMDGVDFEGRDLVVNPARPREKKDFKQRY